MDRIITPQELEELREKIWRVGLFLDQREYVDSILGTISLRVGIVKGLEQYGVLYFTKPRHCRYRWMRPEDFILITLDRQPVESGREAIKVTDNWEVHRACYLNRSDINEGHGAVVHAHPEDIRVLISQFNPKFGTEDGLFHDFRLNDEESAWILNPQNGRPPRVPIVPNAVPRKLAALVATEIPHANAVLIRQHGIMAVGRTIELAADVVSVINRMAREICKTHGMDGRPKYIEDEDVWGMVDNIYPEFDRSWEEK